MTHLIKARALLGQLEKHGIAASRPTRGGGAGGGPDALLSAVDGRAWLVVLWGGTTVQPTLLPANDSQPTLDVVVDALMGWRSKAVADARASTPSLLVLAPALDAAEVVGGLWRRGEEDITVITARDCKKATLLAQAILRTTAVVLPAAALSLWRAAAVPEVRIDSPWKRKTILRDTAVSAAPLLLDYKQERCARLDLERDREAERLASDLRIRIVTGVAGCGKTLVLVHRAALLAAHFPNARVLLVSFNRPLINDLRRRLARMKASSRVHCLTFNQWLNRVAPFDGEIMSEAELLRWIEQQRADLPAIARISAEGVRDELRWMCDHALASDSYLTAARKGRGMRLSTNQRRDLLTLLLRYRAHLRSEKRADWSEWPLTVKETPALSFRGERFDHLLIDEAQFFAPVWLELLRGSLKDGGHLFLCADPTQGFLKRRHSWSEVGLDVRSRSHRLERPYRSTRAILDFAREFYRRRLPNDDEPLNLPDPAWMETLEPGVVPIVRTTAERQDQLRLIEGDLKQLLARGAPPEHMLVLVAGRQLHADDVVRHLNARLHENAAALAKDDHAAIESITVAHLMAATGLERPIVFLLGADDLFAEESNPLLSDEERAELHLSITRQVYVGITRAMERVVVYSGHASLRM